MCVFSLTFSVHVQQCEEAGEAQCGPVHAKQPHGECFHPVVNQLISQLTASQFSLWVFIVCTKCVFVVFLRQSEHFSFLGVNNQSNLSDMRCRTTFYTALGRLLMVDLGKHKHTRVHI